jgi:uncharacterized membrane protein YhaH (DUF805 family)/cold shock CspA family protein
MSAMRGEVVHYDEGQGFGFLAGADGNNYSFRREDLRREARLPKGTEVEFEAVGGQAKRVFTIRAMGQATATSVPSVPAAPLRSVVPQHFGRYAAPHEPVDASLWGYFQRALTVNYASFRGRARRKEYWGYFLFWIIALAVACGAAAALDAALGNLDGSGAVPVVTIIVSVLFVLGTIIPSLGITVRRLHDIGLSGWFYLLVFVPSVGSLIIFVMTLIPSQKHDNKWGPVPQGVPIPAPYTPTPTPTAT